MLCHNFSKMIFQNSATILNVCIYICFVYSYTNFPTEITKRNKNREKPASVPEGGKDDMSTSVCWMSESIMQRSNILLK